MKNPSLMYVSILAVLLSSCTIKKPEVEIEGELKRWHTITLHVPGNYAAEYDYWNPFLDYRLDVAFTKPGDTLVAPGYFAADGQALEEGSESGNIWNVKFVPPDTGTWHYRVHFERARGIAVSDSTGYGEPLRMHGDTGSFRVTETDKEPPDFRAGGRLVNGGKHYLVHAGTGESFIKTGTNSPENFLAYYGFDQTEPTHLYKPHAGDWQEGDPDWNEGDGRNIVGAVNYLASAGVNSVYMLTMNVMGDGDDVWPWINKTERTRYDVSKLEQWDRLFSYMEKKGIMIHLVTQERENQVLLDQGETGTIRKLYYRELVARFGHHLGVIWNLGEENGRNYNTSLAQDTRMRKDMLRYIKKIHHYDPVVVIHTHVAEKDHDRVLEPLLETVLDGPSLQIEGPGPVHEHVLKWRKASAASGANWICTLDEIGHFRLGVVPDDADPEHDTIRDKCLWGTLMAGGAGVEWYFGYGYPHNDLTAEDFRTRANMWEQSRYARKFFEGLPVEEMMPADQLVSGGGSYCFTSPGVRYVVYMPPGERSFTLMHDGDGGEFALQWFNPRTGEMNRPEAVHLMEGDNRFSVPKGFDRGDWVARLTLE